MADKSTQVLRGRQKRPRIPDSLRKRAAKACIPCRQHKERCGGGNPCTRCQKQQRICHFESNSRRGTSRTGTSNSTIDQAPFRLNDKFPQMKRIINHFLGNVSFETADLQHLADTLEGSQERFDWGATAPGYATPSNDYSLDPLSTSTMHYSGELSHWNFSMMLERRLSVPGSITNQEVSAHFQNGFFRPTALQSSESCLRLAKTYFPPKNIAHFLTDTFIKYARTNYFYFDESTFLEKLEFYYTHDSELSIAEAGWVCTLLMTFAVGTQFAHMQTRAASTPERAPDHHIGLELYRFCCRLIPDLITVANMETVQAFMLLGVYTLPIDAAGLAYTFFGLAIKMAIQNGMHRRMSERNIDPEIIELRNRLWWSAYSLESRIGILHGRPVSILLQEIDTPMPTDLPSLRPAAPSSHLPNFISTVTLVNSLSRASGLIKSLRICSAFRKRNLLRQLAIHRNQLNSWWDTLLIETHCQNIKHDEPSFRCNIHLEIYYSTVLIYLGRPFIFQEASAPLQVASEATSESSAYTYEASEIANSLCGDSLHASIRVIELCQHLEDSFGLAHVSYTEFNGCRVALLALIAHSIRNPNITLSNFLNQGMSLIRNMCVGLESARSEIVVLESLERARERLFGHLELDNQHAKKELAGYEQFREWANLWKPEAMERDIASGLTDSGTVFEQPFFDSTASFDTSFSSFPLELQEFSVIPGLNYEL